ncbi:Serine/threonine-protein phosphatase pgam5, mitochondrial [Parelaphostrongylus tenuis]|uniref:Serine/threonine-protein phosphatase pgam5, mitochondrial n=1 Tax=Parelaphostrongylus tenuis TaxID=148309 RepID=A0AAD5RD21_PARTN|nr:Serine/threonine-protein phosphatase pgam5, mitochondrial [Parelaphostrongylus tenuis]
MRLFVDRKTFDDHFPRGQWNDNWDFRSPEYLINSKKYAEASEEERKRMEEETKAKATRNIILIRHGQYFMDTERKNLTPLGREQAALVGSV